MNEFKKVDKFINGKMTEVFYIDDKEVEEKVYYSMLEEKYTNSDQKIDSAQNTVNQYCVDILNQIKENPNQAEEILNTELMYIYKIGYNIGQYDITSCYAQKMNENCSEIKKELQKIDAEYET